jgi:hypothetical protein
MKDCEEFRDHNPRRINMKTALKVVDNNDGVTKKPIRVKGRVMNYNTDRRLKKNRGKKRSYVVQRHVRTRKEHTESNVFMFVKVPTEHLKTAKSMLKALGCTHRVIEV